MAGLQSGERSPQLAAPPDTSGGSTAPLTALLTGTADSGCERVREVDPDLARVLDAWPGLPEYIKAAVLALVESAGPRRP